MNGELLLALCSIFMRKDSRKRFYQISPCQKWGRTFRIEARKQI